MGRTEGLGLRRLRRALGDQRVTLLGAHTDIASLVTPRGREVDLVVSWFFPKKLPATVLAYGALGTLGVHPSLLPRHRGPDPYFAAIDQGDAVTGVTAHRLEREYDTGRMLDHEELAIDPSWSAWTLARKLDRPSLRVLRRVVQRIARDPSTIDEREQDDAAATAAPEPSAEQLELDVNGMDAARALRRIRAAAPWPGAYFFAGDDCVVIERAAPSTSSLSLAAGELAALPDGRVVLGFAEGALVLERVRVASSDDEDEVTLSGVAWHAWVHARV